MKPIKFTVNYKALDGYLYGGRLFIICNDGFIRYIPFHKIIDNNLDIDSEEHRFFKLAFTRTNWITNKQAQSLLNLSKMKKEFERLWIKYSKMEYFFEINDEHLKVLSEIDSMPVFDFRIYGMRILYGNRNGLHEAGISLINDLDVNLNESIERVFDSRITGITSKSGSLMLSSNSDGLFHGRMNEIDERVEVNEIAVKPESLRTGWSGYDVVNYVSQDNFDYLKNEYEADNKRRYLYSSDDEDSKKIRITKVASETLVMDHMLENVKIPKAEIIFSFNSSDNCFLILKDGRLLISNWRKHSRNNKDVKLSSRIYEISKLGARNLKLNKPISSTIVPKGCVLEFFDKVILIHGSKKYILENKGVTSIRSFPSSIRYQSIISIFDGAQMSFYSTYPIK